MANSPSPVRASAQELAKLIRQHTFEEFDVSLEESASLIAEALTAAEARGRQQAEQARDEESRKLAIAEADHEHWRDFAAEQAKQVAALTQALKDIAAHKLCEDEPSQCYQDSGPYCGKHIFDDHLVKIARAALTGAPKPVSLGDS